MSILDSLYSKLPVHAQNLAISAYGLYWRWLRFGPGYQAALADYLTREKYSHQEWQAWSQVKLAELLKLAATQVPYYKIAWNMEQQQAAFECDYQSLPLLEKGAIRAQPRAFIRQDIHAGREYTFHTSGTSGTPIASIWLRAEIRASLAIREARSARWAGVSFSRPRATFSGRLVEPHPNSKGPYYRYNSAERQVYLSPYHLRPDTARGYIQAIEEYKVEWLTGYAVSY